MTAPVEIVTRCANRLGEAPLWLAEQNALLWIDLPTGELWRYEAESGAVTSRLLGVPAPLGAIVRGEDNDTLLVTHRHGIARLGLSTLATGPFADPEQGRDAVMYNDAKVDRAGRLWAGTSHVAESEARGALWIVDGGVPARLVDAGFAIANGPAFSPDGCTTYFSDSATRQVFAYEMAAANAAPRNRRLFCRFADGEGLPDGLTVDADGCLWIAHWAGARISRWTPEGRKLTEIPIPAHHVTSLCFGGPDLTDLYVTSAWDGMDAAARAAAPSSGDLFRLSSGAKGIAEPRARLA
jgi:sugar lactone lactonase YvrE